MTAGEARKAIQRLLHTQEDGVIGKMTLQALTHLCDLPDASPWPVESSDPSAVHSVLASSFADPADISAFRHCKALGGTDQHCFGIGDNGIGKWGDATGPGSGPCCALPPEDWAQFGDDARGKGVIVEGNGMSVLCELLDTMPNRKNITNGCGIDLNYDACRALGFSPPLKGVVTWRWA